MVPDSIHSPLTQHIQALAAPSRRTFTVSAIGISAFSLFSGCLQFLSDAGDDSVDHFVVVSSVRQSNQEVSVRTEFDGETSSYGPRDIGYQARWEVAQFTKPGELTVTFSVDGDVVWEDTHELPKLSGSRRSFSLLELQPDGEILTRVSVEE